MQSYGTEYRCGTCDRTVARGENYTRGLCDTCYRRLLYAEKRVGVFGAPSRRLRRRRYEREKTQRAVSVPAVDRVLSRVSPGHGGCWLYTGALNLGGYGVVKTSSKHLLAHRVTYEAYVGPIPDGLVTDHLCRVRRCVRPDHLEPVTDLINARRSPISLATINSQITHCPQGHAYDEQNTTHRRGRRICDSCERARDKRRDRRRSKN